ncbi:division/cell wall cluster transcriptional repressor MraZ [Spiroplasma culicicola]|uniref:Transcriptional regulator MraZ n=1 Tax=Spiroplasma culicicola AES-1 TaxID=1276246 RepID=W6A7L2_9MOLU|nr:division/cell wall cluster transcriptional repressor MraZ [Spiroplasma culicicola]AHI53128.1 cell division protein MraZ [Spiroplasma culicicola AES-1]
MLLGTFEHNLDDKSRLTIPSKLRNKLGDMIFVSKGIENCLELRTPEEFKKLLSDLGQKSSFNAATRKIERLVLSNSDELSIDNAGRIKIPANLLEKIGVTKQVYILGLGDRVEIWDKVSYERLLEEQDEAEIYEAAEQLGGVK